MVLSEKMLLLRKQNNLTQEQFAEEMSVSRQTVSKWERGESVPDLGMLAQIADYYELSMDQLARDEYGILPEEGWVASANEGGETAELLKGQYEKYVGMVCDISMKSFRYSVIRNAEIIGVTDGFICFVKNGKPGFANMSKVMGLLEKKDGSCAERLMELLCGRCTVYVNAGTYFGGTTYLFSEITEVSDGQIVIKTGKFTARVALEDVSVIQMKEAI